MHSYQQPRFLPTQVALLGEWCAVLNRPGVIVMRLMAMLLLAMVVLAMLFLAPVNSALAAPPTVQQGVLKAPNWAFNDGQELQINGEWQVIWGKIVSPEDFAENYQGDYFTLPARWNKVQHPDMQGALGSATFRAQLSLPEYPQSVSYHMIAAHSAYRVFIDGRLVASNGTVSDRPSEVIPNYVSRQFSGQSGDSELLLQVSNYAHAYGGPGHALKLYDSQSLKQLLDTLSVIYGLVVGIVLTIGVFHLMLYLAERDHAHAAVQFWFSLLCFIIVYRVQGIIPLVHEYFHDTAYWRSLRWPYISLYAAPAVYLMFFRALFPSHFPQRLTLVPVALAVLGVLYSLTQSEYAYTSTRDFAIWLNVFVIVYSLVFTTAAVLAKEAGARVILVVNALFLVTAIYDAIIYTDQSSGFDLTPFGILALGGGYSYALFLGLRARFLAANENANALRTINIELEQQVAERTKAFKAAANKAQNAASDKARFIAAASHDLRQPLHALALFTSALRQKLGGSNAAPLIERQENAITNLGSLLQDTLDAARLDKQQDTLNLSLVNSADVRDKLLDSFADSALSKGIALSIEADRGEFLTDPIMLQRILSNLLDNALKAARKSVQVTISSQDNGWQFSVIDDGPGIPQQDIDRVFNSYVSLEQSDEDDIGGYGLGLYVVKEFTRSLGAKVEVASDQQGGCCFILTLPPQALQPALDSSGDSPSPDWSKLRGSKVLAVDDDVEILAAVDALLSEWGCQVITVNTADQALASAQKLQPQIVLLDYHLQGRTGLECLAALKRQTSLPLAAIFITGATEPKIVERLQQAGAQVLHKPVSPSALADALLSAVARNTGTAALANSN